MRDSGGDRIAAGQDALQRHAWREAFEHLRAADAPPGSTLSAPRTVTLKGVSEPLAVVTLGWR